jgi:hypothetical protein
MTKRGVLIMNRTPAPHAGPRNTKIVTQRDEAKKDGRVVISMKKDWKRIFGFDSAP